MIKTEHQSSFVGCGNILIYTVTLQLARQLTPSPVSPLGGPPANPICHSITAGWKHALLKRPSLIRSLAATTATAHSRVNEFS
jgi:hypothetical protein